MSTRITPGLAGAPTDVDVVVIGLGITGAGVALDAVTRGLSVLAVDAHDLAFGTSRWSSKLVHGGLRYLAKGQVGVAHESAVERGILMEVTAPHLTHAMPMLIPLSSASPRRQAGRRPGAGLLGGDLLRRARPHQLGDPPAAAPDLRAPRRSQLAPPLRTAGLRGGLLGWDGQLEDDARLVTTVARTAASYGAHVRTRARVLARDRHRGRRCATSSPAPRTTVTARTVVNATGVWAGDLVAEVTLRPSRGTHLVLRAATDPRPPGRGLRAGPRRRRTASSSCSPSPTARSTSASPTSRSTAPIPDVPEPTEPEIGFLLDVVVGGVRAAAAPHRRGRRLRRAAAAARLAGRRRSATADLSRRHAVLTSRTGVVTIVGGKLTTYRRMAEDAVDAAVAHAGLDAGAVPDPRRCRCSAPPTAADARRARAAGPAGPHATAPTPGWCSRPPARSPG